jgi:A/G-specific adenine glycosylase
MRLTKNLYRDFSLILLKWNREKNDRKMPWKGEKDPYKIWLSEIILQQTRVEQGLGYYQKFVEQFPTIQDLAKCPDSKIYKLWEGLGYYNRCKNLIQTARFVSNKLNGVFPDKYEEIMALKGVGSYTASAIASFAYNLPYAVVDGNVFRVLSRIFGIKKAIDSTEGKKYFTKLASELLKKNEAGAYNQALMDFGAVVCKPVNPVCGNCVFKKHCKAFQNDMIGELPFKEKRNKIKKRWFYYIMMEFRGRIYIKQRTDNDIWKNLFEFVLLETESLADADLILSKAVKKGIISDGSYTIQSVSEIRTQLLSHQKISGQFIKIKLSQKIDIPGFILVSQSQLNNYAFPKFIKSYLNVNFS